MKGMSVKEADLCIMILYDENNDLNVEEQCDLKCAFFCGKDCMSID